METASGQTESTKQQRGNGEGPGVGRVVSQDQNGAQEIEIEGVLGNKFKDSACLIYHDSVENS